MLSRLPSSHVPITLSGAHAYLLEFLWYIGHCNFTSYVGVFIAVHHQGNRSPTQPFKFQLHPCCYTGPAVVRRSLFRVAEQSVLQIFPFIGYLFFVYTLLTLCRHEFPAIHIINPLEQKHLNQMLLLITAIKTISLVESCGDSHGHLFLSQTEDIVLFQISHKRSFVK